MAEYIDRKKLMDDISKYSIENYSGLIWSVVMKQPAEDVVEVVRCMNCKMGFKKFVGNKEVVECQRHAYDDPRQYKFLDDFCSYGVSKQEETP